LDVQVSRSLALDVQKSDRYLIRWHTQSTQGISFCLARIIPTMPSQIDEDAAYVLSPRNSRRPRPSAPLPAPAPVLLSDTLNLSRWSADSDPHDTKSEDEISSSAPASAAATRKRKQSDSCVCGSEREKTGDWMIACDLCDVWFHAGCIGMDCGEDQAAERDFLCGACLECYK